MSPPLPVQLSRCEAKLASLPRVGLRFALPNRFGQLTWLGYGPQESYPDRKAGSDWTVHCRDVDASHVQYIVPSENGGKADVQWAAFTASSGEGLLLEYSCDDAAAEVDDPRDGKAKQRPAMTKGAQLSASRPTYSQGQYMFIWIQRIVALVELVKDPQVMKALKMRQAHEGWFWDMLKLFHRGGLMSSQPPDTDGLVDAVVPALAETVERLEELHGGLVDEGERPERPVTPQEELASLLERAQELSEVKIPEALQSRKNRPPKVTEGQKATLAQLSVAARLRGRLADFEELAPQSRPTEEAPDTLGILSHWHEKVSKEELGRSDAAQVLSALIRGERTIAELQRSEAACTRRWAALSQEARQRLDRIKGLRLKAQSCDERQRSMLLAAGERRKVLWSQLCNQSDQPETASRVHDQLLKLDSQRQELQSAISTCQAQLHRVASKRRQALRILDSTTQLGGPRTGETATGESGGAKAPALETIIQAELEAESLLWDLYLAERGRERRTEAMSDAIPSAPQRPDEPPKDEWPGQPSEVPTFAPQPDLQNDPADFTWSVEHAQPGEAPLTGAPLAPRVAQLIQRLALSRDDRREYERAQRAGGGPERRDGSPVRHDPIGGTQPALSLMKVVLDPEGVKQPPALEEPVWQDEAPVWQDEAAVWPAEEPIRWPSLPEFKENENEPIVPEPTWKASAPEVIWGELPFAPLYPQLVSQDASHACSCLSLLRNWKHNVV
ncbi:unnamed protein product [Durusdinium trenchii]|uniref:beta-galactosidase n=1 Tax=Durusdinium trenchii TaxID=1381693 RepID=A0ABP0I261_9DINO